MGNCCKKEKSSASSEPKTCASCKETITAGVLTALGKSWHPEHFCCNSCKNPITESKFHTHEEQPVCNKCFVEKYTEKCNACGEAITDKVLQAMGVHWHEDHFVCGDCKSKLIGTKFMEIEGKPYCLKCYTDKHAARCKGCGKPIADKAIVALDAKWHQMCFRCAKCEKPIMRDQSYKVLKGVAQCYKC
ncbi:leupaxin isoform X4 [Aethina tumida]|uniref:leupaxin isoform X4 n=1 Tax=Aethina tumida TaxID=116153 RepID=UPI00214990B0|nr:leupaxin isoform X4 [Aethina tumida]